MKLTLDHNVIIDLASGSINIARLREILAKQSMTLQIDALRGPVLDPSVQHGKSDDASPPGSCRPYRTTLSWPCLHGDVCDRLQLLRAASVPCLDGHSTGHGAVEGSKCG